MYPQNVYEKVLKEDCVMVDIVRFDYVLDIVYNTKLTEAQRYIFDKTFKEGCKATLLMYEFGYRGVSVISRKIDRIIKLIREEVNFRFCEKDNILSTFLGKVILKKAGIKNCTIQEALEMYGNPEYEYGNKYDQIIAYTLLKRFNYAPDIRKWVKLDDIPEVVAYCTIITPEDEKLKDGENFLQYDFIRNIRKAARKAYSYNQTHAEIAETLSGIGKFKSRFYYNCFIRLIHDPDCMYTEKYFGTNRIKDIPLHEIFSISPELIDKCHWLITSETSLSAVNLYSMIYAVICQRHNRSSILTDEDIECLEKAINEMRSKNKFIENEVKFLEHFIETRHQMTVLHDPV